jgi:hypothetical protein
MNRLCIATRGISSWRERLANPERQWKRHFSAFETAVSWELASKNKSGLPEQIETIFRNSRFGESLLVFAVAEHKVDLHGKGPASQSDVWCVVNTTMAGMVSLTVEGKAKEKFGNDILRDWLVGGEDEENRSCRFEHIRLHLPISPLSDSFHPMRYQILHRCAASVMEAKRLGFQNAAFIVQAFDAPTESFEDYSVFCQALNIPARREHMEMTSADNISLGIGWVDCPFANDSQVTATV